MHEKSKKVAKYARSSRNRPNRLNQAKQKHGIGNQRRLKRPDTKGLEF